MEQIHCPACGAENRADAKICAACGAALKAEKASGEKKTAPKRKNKSAKATKHTHVLVPLLLCIAIAALGAFLAYGVFHNSRIDKNMEKADSLYESGDYARALPVYRDLNTQEADAKVDSCLYELGKAAMAEKNWTGAIDRFESIGAADYRDTKALIEKCELEMRRSGFADDAFLADLERAVKGRMEDEGDTAREGLVNAELNLLADYQSKSFYDEALGQHARDYIAGLEKQRASLTEPSRHTSQLVWVEGFVESERTLCALYNDYRFMADNDAFVRKYVANLDSDQAYYLALREINDDIARQTSQVNFSESYYLSTYSILRNNTQYTIGVDFVFDIYTYANGRYLTTDEYFVEDVPSRTDYTIYVPVTDYEYNTYCYIDWEVTGIRS